MSVRMIPFSSDKKAGICDALFSVQEAEKAVAFHRSLHGYEATPLRHLKNLSKVLNISGLYVKDESRRFGLNAFKGLGGSYALAKVMAEKTGMGLEDVSMEIMEEALLGLQKICLRKQLYICRKVLLENDWRTYAGKERKRRLQI